MIRDKDTANLVNKMRVSRHRKNPSLDKERTRGTVTNKYLHRQQDKKELQNKLQKTFSMSENVEYILDTLVSEGYVDNYDSAACILEAYLAVYEANKWEKESGIGGKSPEAELARMRSRAFHTGGVKPKTAVNPSDIPAGTVRMNRGVARMVHARNRGKSPSDPTYSHRKKIDPPKTPSYRESPLGLPKGYKDPLNRDPRKKSPGDKIKSPIKSLPKETPVNAKNKIIKLQREELEYIINILVSEGYAANYDSAACILEAMSDEWLIGILDEAPFDIYRGNTTIDDTKVGSSEPIKVNKKPYKTRKGANRTADKLNQDYGANIYQVRRIREQ
jgi:hypothetical protein